MANTFERLPSLEPELINGAMVHFSIEFNPLIRHYLLAKETGMENRVIALPLKGCVYDPEVFIPAKKRAIEILETPELYKKHLEHRITIK